MLAAQVIQIVLGQIALTVLLVVILAVAMPGAAMSALAGGLATAVPNLFFAKRVFSKYDAQQPGHLLGTIYGAEISKLLMTGLIFFAAIAWLKPLYPAALFISYLIVHLFPAAIVSAFGNKHKKTG